MEEKRKRREKINQHRATRTAIHLFSILPGRPFIHVIQVECVVFWRSYVDIHS